MRVVVDFPSVLSYVLFRGILADIGAAYGTAKSGVGISSMGVMNPGLVMRNIIPVVMAGVLGIYGLIVAVILSGSSEWTARQHAVDYTVHVCV